jgi:hypothetical protein
MGTLIDASALFLHKNAKAFLNRRRQSLHHTVERGLTLGITKEEQDWLNNVFLPTLKEGRLCRPKSKQQK